MAQTIFAYSISVSTASAHSKPISVFARKGSPSNGASFRRGFKPVNLDTKQSSIKPIFLPTKGGTGKFVAGSHGSSETFQIKKSEPVLICPATKTYNGLYFLSGTDHNAMIPLEMLYSFKGDAMKNTDNACEVIKKALAEVLVHFYPLAGRMTIGPDGDFTVNCTGEGVYFVEAFLDHDLDAFGDITTPNAAKLCPLLHLHQTKDILLMPLLTIQVTVFKCGGFIIGTALNHCMMDGASITLFMNSCAEIARGLPLSVPPFLDRSILKPRQVSKTDFPPHLLSKIDGLFYKRDIAKTRTIPQDDEKIYVSVHFCSDKLQKLRETVMEEGIKCIPTNFELVTAHMCRGILSSLSFALPRYTKVYVPVNARIKLGPLFPQGYFGNCLGLAYIVFDANQSIKSYLSRIVEDMQEGVQLLTRHYLESLREYSEAMGLQLVEYQNFCMS